MIVIRPATLADARRMWEIDQLCFDADIAYPLEFIEYHLLLPEAAPAFAAMDGEVMAGFVITEMERRATGVIVTIDLLPRYRRHGSGTRLMDTAEAALARLGAQRMELQTPVENGAAMAFYERCGYRRGARLKDYYLRGRDAWQYRKEL